MVKPPLKYLPVAGILLLLCITGYFFVRTAYKGDKIPLFSDLPPEAALTVKDFQAYPDNADEGTRYVLEADEGIYSQDRERISLNSFLLKLEPQNSPPMEIRGNKADWDTVSKVIILSGDLKGDGPKGYRIFTDKLTFEQDEGILKTDEPVKITGPFFIMTGKGLLCDPESETFKILSDVTTLMINKDY